MIISFFTRVLVAAYFLEAGFILIVAPWTTLWDRNFFAASAPALRPWVENPFLRGAVSGLGGITAVAGLWELGALFRRRRAPAASHGDEQPDRTRWNLDS